MKLIIINIVIKIIELIANSLTMSPIGDEIYYYKWWKMAMVVDKDGNFIHGSGYPRISDPMGKGMKS